APGGTPREASAGVATSEDLGSARVGAAYTLAASASPLKGAESRTFDVTLVAGSATHQSFATPPSDVDVSQIMPPVRVEALDDNGARVTGYTGTITLALAPNLGAPGGTTSPSMVNGLRTF